MNIKLYAVLFVCFAGCSSTPKKDKITDPLGATRFTRTVVADGLEEPLQLEFDKEGYVYWIERTGGLKRVKESTGRINELGQLPVYEGRAPGLIGILLDEDFKRTQQIYLYYSAAADEGKYMRLSRFTLGVDKKLEMKSEIVMLKVPWEQPDGTHMGGGMTWDAKGNLYLAVGGDTKPSKYAPIHFLDGVSSDVQDAARTGGNTNDLRGSILRIKPQPDGSYTIPEENLFKKGTAKTRPEIYVMGNRNPWRLSVDTKTGYLHWGEVGPDAGIDSDKYGPKGYDELNIARKAGNFGWPFVIGKNRPYNIYDYQSNTYKEPVDPKNIINISPNNTGLRELPPSVPALVAYPYGVSDKWPILSNGARSVVGGPVFRSADFESNAPRVFPDYYEGKWFVTDYVRSWIMIITMNDERTAATSIERFLPAGKFSYSQPLDMDFGPSGDLYLVEYGTQGRISRIQYNAGNRKPLVQAHSPKASGATPLEVQLSSEGTVDYDGDDLVYEWRIQPEKGEETLIYHQKNPVITLEEPGRYEVELKVSDSENAVNMDSLEIVAGNHPPDVNLKVTRGNRSFYFPDNSIEYELQVKDREDGSLRDGDIPAEKVDMTAVYLPSVLSPSKLAALQSKDKKDSQTPLRHLQAKELINNNNCKTCHTVNSTLVGPPFMAVAKKYRGDNAAAAKITHSIREGSEGKWGETPMPPNTMLSQGEADLIASYILSLVQTDSVRKEVPLQGSFSTVAHEIGEGGGGRIEQFFDVPYQRGSYVLTGSYTDKGNRKVKGLNLHGEDYVLLRYPLLAPESADVLSEEGTSFTPSTNDPGFIVSGPMAYIGFKNIDLRGISKINIGALTRFYNWTHFIGANVELRLDSPAGKLVDQPKEQFPSDSLEAEDAPFLGEDLDKPVSIDVSGVEGIHDLYLVFKNAEADSNDALLILTGIEFTQ